MLCHGWEAQLSIWSDLGVSGTSEDAAREEV